MSVPIFFQGEHFIHCKSIIIVYGLIMVLRLVSNDIFPVVRLVPSEGATQQRGHDPLRDDCVGECRSAMQRRQTNVYVLF